MGGRLPLHTVSLPGGPLWLEALPLGAMVGSAVYTSTAFALYACGLPIDPALLLALAPGALAVLLLTRALATARCLPPQDIIPPIPHSSLATRHSGYPLAGRSTRYLTALAVIICGGQVGDAALIAVRAPFNSWDAWSFWFFKARMFVSGGPPPGYFQDATLLYSHPDYPLHVPLLEATLAHLPGRAGVVCAALVPTAFLAALLLLFYGVVRRLYGQGSAAVGVALLALVPALSLQAAGGDADVPLAAYAGGAALYLLSWWRTRQPFDAVAMGLLAGAAAWTKREGDLLVLLFGLIYLGGEVGARRAHAGPRRFLVAPLAALVLVPLPWFLFGVVQRPAGTDFLPLTPAVALAHLDRIPAIALRFLAEPLVTASWSLLWVALAGALLLALATRRVGGATVGLLATLGGQLLLYAAIFLFSGWVPYTLHIQASIDRLYVQAAPLAMLLLVDLVTCLYFPGLRGP